MSNFVVKWGSLSFGGSNVDEFTSFLAFGEDNDAVDESEEGVILTHADVVAGMVDGATLTLDNVASLAVLTTENLNAETFAF